MTTFLILAGLALLVYSAHRRDQRHQRVSRDLFGSTPAQLGDLTGLKESQVSALLDDPVECLRVQRLLAAAYTPRRDTKTPGE